MAAMALLVALPARAAEVISSNTVGYSRLEIKPGLNMIAMPFIDLERDQNGKVQNKEINGLFDNDADVVNANRNSIAADQMWVWDAAEQKYINYYYMTDRKNSSYRWENDEGTFEGLQEPVGAGFFFQNKGEETYRITLSGEVNMEDTIINILPGLNFISNPYPIDLPLNDGSIDWTNANANRNSIQADQMWFWDASEQTYNNFYYMTDRKNTYYRWENDAGEFDGVAIPAYTGFFYNYKGEGTGFTLTLKNPVANTGN